MLTARLQVFLSPTEDRLKDVFFGREPWLVLCDTNGTVDSVFEAVSRRDKGVKFGVLDCAAQLPSKKSTFERLKLNQNAGNPVLFFSGFGRDPKQASCFLCFVVVAFPLHIFRPWGTCS